MTPDFLARGAPAAVLAALPEARAVGGAVRDFLAGKPIHDVDVAVPLPPTEVVPRLRSAGLKVFETGLQHGTVTAVLEREPVEVTSLRRDVATDGRHAEVEWIGDWHEDAARRDFTINAMSMGVDGVLHDYFGGEADLAAGRVRFVGVPGERLAEDFLRALRFFRFWARYGLGAPDTAAVTAIRDAVPGLAKLSVERVWMEIKRLLTAPDPTDALRLMAETGVLGAVLPAGMDTDAIATLNAIGAPADILLRFAALSRRVVPVDIRVPTTGKPYSFSGEEILVLTYLHDIRDQHPTRPTHAPLLPALSDDALRTERARFAMVYPERIAEAVQPWRSWLAQAFAVEVGAEGFSGAEWDALRQRMADQTVPRFPLQGRDAIAVGIPPGAAMGELLRKVSQWWLEHHARPEHAECLEKLREFANRTAEQ